MEPLPASEESLTPCLTLDDEKVTARVRTEEPLLTGGEHLDSLSRPGSNDREQRHRPSFSGDWDSLGDQSSSSCQVWVPLGWIPHSSSLKAHRLTVLCPILSGRTAQLEGNSVLRLVTSPRLKYISRLCHRQNIPGPLLCAQN